MLGKQLVVFTGLVMSMASYAGRLPVDDAIDGLRAKAEHLEIMKTMLTKNHCVAHYGTHQYPLAAASMRGNGLIVAISDSVPGQYLAFGEAPKAQLLKQIVTFTHRKNVNRVFILSSSLKAKPGAETYTHLNVALAEPVYNKDMDGTDYVKVAVNVPLAGLEKGYESKELGFANGGGLRVTCNK